MLPHPSPINSLPWFTLEPIDCNSFWLDKPIARIWVFGRFAFRSNSLADISEFLHSVYRPVPPDSKLSSFSLWTYSYIIPSFFYCSCNMLLIVGYATDKRVRPESHVDKRMRSSLLVANIGLNPFKMRNQPCYCLMHFPHSKLYDNVSLGSNKRMRVCTNGAPQLCSVCSHS